MAGAVVGAWQSRDREHLLSPMRWSKRFFFFHYIQSEHPNLPTTFCQAPYEYERRARTRDLMPFLGCWEVGKLKEEIEVEVEVGWFYNLAFRDTIRSVRGWVISRAWRICSVLFHSYLVFF